MLPKVTPHDRSGFLYEKGQYSVHAGYYMCAKKIRQILSPTQKTLSEKDIQNKLKKSEFFVSLSALLQKYFNKTLCVTLQDDSLEFCFVDTA